MTVMALAVLLAVAGSEPEAAVRRLLVMPLEVRPGAPEERVSALSEYLISEARRVPGYRVLSMKDLEQLLGAEMRNQLTGCSESGCLAELAGALAADEVLYGSVGRLGARELVLTLNRIAPSTATALAGESERLPSSSTDGMLDSTAGLLKRLYPAYELPPRLQAVSKPRLALAMTTLGAVLQYAAVSSATFSLFGFFMFGPLGLPFLIPAAAFYLGGPAINAWVSAWLMDVMGRRQSGTRRATALGVGMVPITALVASLPVQAASSVGALSGFAALFVGVLFVSAMQERGYSTLLQGVVVGGTAIASGVVAALGSAFLVSLALIPAIVLLVVVVPALQSVILLRDSEPRPPGEEARLPGLYAPGEDAPDFLESLPEVIVGALPPPPPGMPPPPGAPAR